MTDTALPAAPAALGTTERKRDTDARVLTVSDVSAQIVQNICGGVGMGGAVATVMWMLGVPIAVYWRWPVGVGALTACAAIVYRAYVDEYVARWHRRNLQAQVDALVLDIADIERERDQWREIARAARAKQHRAENDLTAARLLLAHNYNAASAPSRSRTMQDLYDDDARRDARELLHAWYTLGKWPGYRRMGWPRTRHSVARDLLIRAQVVTDTDSATDNAPRESEAWAVERMEAWLGQRTPYDDAQAGLMDDN